MYSNREAAWDHVGNYIKARWAVRGLPGQPDDNPQRAAEQYFREKKEEVGESLRVMPQRVFFPNDLVAGELEGAQDDVIDLTPLEVDVIYTSLGMARYKDLVERVAYVSAASSDMIVDAVRNARTKLNS
jgi:hypothetical protein